MKKDRIVIIGADAAGMSAATKVRRMQPERGIAVFEKTAHTSYSACGMPYLIGGLVDSADRLVVRSPETFHQEYNIDIRTLHEVCAIDPIDQRIEVVANGPSNRTINC